MGLIYLIAGTPGVGKTTVALEVAKRLGLRHVELARLVREEGLTLGYDEERLSHIVDVDAARRRVRELVAKEDLVVDTHVVEAVPPDLVKVCVVLRLDPRVLEERLRRRGYPEGKVLENVQCEILDSVLIDAVNMLGEERVFEVDCTGKSVEEVVEQVIKAFKEGKGLRPGSVSWIERLGDEAFKLLSRRPPLSQRRS